VCARVPTTNVAESTDPRFCATGECHDEILIEAVRARAATLRRDTVLVLHMMGSHGPAYHKRIPADFARIQPACGNSQFSRCTRNEIIAAYDNTIVYTDHVLAELAGVLDGLAGKGHATALLYVSDHGESLGEGNVFLHGMPNAVAPRGRAACPVPDLAVDRLQPALRD
jgi:lipid A ethanolaminephosphotransferase